MTVPTSTLRSLSRLRKQTHDGYRASNTAELASAGESEESMRNNKIAHFFSSRIGMTLSSCKGGASLSARYGFISWINEARVA
jgi:hypothetical protein